jgi:hypothetical protein
LVLVSLVWFLSGSGFWSGFWISKFGFRMAAFPSGVFFGIDCLLELCFGSFIHRTKSILGYCAFETTLVLCFCPAFSSFLFPVLPRASQLTCLTNQNQAASRWYLLTLSMAGQAYDDAPASPLVLPICPEWRGASWPRAFVLSIPPSAGRSLWKTVRHSLCGCHFETSHFASSSTL